MDIYLTDKYNNRIRFPLLPETISVNESSKYQSYDLMDIGEVKLPAGENLPVISWVGVLPGEARKNDPYIHGNWTHPKEIVSTLSQFRSSEEKVTLLITETPINKYVYIDEFQVTYEGFAVDSRYSIILSEAKDLNVATEMAAAPQSVSRPAPKPSNTYTVVRGDCLWNIAIKFYGKGSLYTRIYEANKSQIKDPHWIYPGQVFVIP